MSRTQIGVFYYDYRIDDLIERYTTQTDFFFFRNRGEGRIKGFELETRTDLGQGYSLELGAQIGRGELTDDGSNLDDISPDTFLALVRKDFGERAFGQVRMAFLADDDRPGPSEVAAPGATVIDLAGGWHFTRNLELRGLVRNLLDDSVLREPRSAVGVGGRTISEPHAWGAVLVALVDRGSTTGCVSIYQCWRGPTPASSRAATARRARAAGAADSRLRDQSATTRHAQLEQAPSSFLILSSFF